VAETLTKGLSSLHPSAQVSVLIGGVIGIVCEILSKKTKGKFPFSGVGLGLAFVLRFADSLAMAMGAFIFWYASRKYKNPQSLGHKIWVANQETLCAGVVAGGSMIGMILILLENVVLKN
jgi:hypothetical protein